MRWRQDLQVGLRSRYRRLYTATGTGLAHEIDLVTSWIAKQPSLMYLVQEARSVESTPDPEEWLATATARRGDWEWPTKTEAGRAVFIWDVLQHISASSQPILQFLFIFSDSQTLNEMARDFAEQVAQPLVDYLDEQIGEGTSVLYAIERYVRQIEWFDRDRLYVACSAAPRQAEDTYDRHLREFLFREGFNMPYSQQRSPSGLSDVLSDLESDDSLVCELKLYDGDNRGIAHLAGGVTQALQYATDYGKSAAHLVIINLTARPLLLPNDGSVTAKPPYLDLPGVRVYLIQVRGLPRQSASKQGRTEPLIVKRAKLVGDGS
jgi:hypothetical protein